MSLQRLKWLTVIGPIVFLAVVDELRRTLAGEFMQSWVGDLLVAGVVLFAVLLFSQTVFGRIEQMQSTLERQNRELLALHEAGLDVAGELELDQVLQKVVDDATDLIGARYGALSVPGPRGGIEAFVTAGLSQAEQERIGPLPTGHGLLSVVLDQVRPLRLANLTTDPRSVVRPPNHPPMRSLVAVPDVEAAGFEQAAQTVAEERVIVGNQQPHRPAARGHIGIVRRAESSTVPRRRRTDARPRICQPLARV